MNSAMKACRRGCLRTTRRRGRSSLACWPSTRTIANAPTVAPSTCATKNTRGRPPGELAGHRGPRVTAGLMWLPEMYPSE